MIRPILAGKNIHLAYVIAFVSRQINAVCAAKDVDIAMEMGAKITTNSVSG